MLKQWVERLSGHRVLVVGDIVLDEYLIGTVERISREAPIPVLELRERRHIVGGAANPAVNIVRLGSMARQVSLIGQDAGGALLRELLAAEGVQTDALVVLADRPTTVKTRVMAQMGLRFPQQVARVDVITRTPLDAHTQAQVIAHVQAHLAESDALLFSDYHAGMLTSELVAALRTYAPQLPCFADAQGSLKRYYGFDWVKCNADDARAFLGQPLVSDADFAAATRTLYDRLALRGAMVITRGADGATLATATTTAHCPAPAIRDVYDTVGAGDTAIALMTLATLAGADAPTAVTLANYASGIVIQHVGNYRPTPDELRAVLP